MKIYVNKSLNVGLLNLKCSTKSRAVNMETYLGENFIPLKLERRKILTENLEVIGSLGSNLLILEFIKTMRVNMITD